LSTASASGALRHRVESLALHSPVRNVVNDMAARQSVLKKRKISSVMMSAEGSDAKEKLTEMEEDPKKAGQWWEEKPDLEGRTKKDVKQWLENLKQRKDLDFKVDDVACDGEDLAAMTKEDLMMLAGTKAGIIIFNAKEQLKKKGQKRSSATTLYQVEKTEPRAPSEEIVAFFEALFLQKITKIDVPTLGDTKKETAILDLQNARLFGKPKKPTKLYIRNEIFEFFNIIKSRIETDNRKTFVCGSSGIGKSTAAPIILKMLRNWKPLGSLFQHEGYFYWIPKKFPESKMLSFANRVAARLWIDDNVQDHFYNFMDPFSEFKICSGFLKAYEILWVSPKRAGKMGQPSFQVRDVTDWGKEALHLYMRHWDPRAILDCNERCYGFDPKIVEEKVRIWGPVPRQVFSQELRLKDILSNTPAAKIREFFLGTRGEGTPDGITSGKLVHLIPSEDRMGSHYRVASSHIRRELLRANEKVIKRLARDLVSNAARGAIASQNAADWLESLVALNFTKSSFTLEARQLTKGSEKATGKLTVEIKEMKHVLFKNFDDVEFNSNTYYEPSWRTLETIDSLFVIGEILYLVQITFSPDHPLKTAGMRRVWRAAKKKVPALEGYCVIFAIPDLSAKKGQDLVAKFKYQPYKQTTGNPVDYSRAPFKFEKGQYLHVLPDSILDCSDGEQV